MTNRIISLLLAAALLCALCACGTQETDYSNQTVVGKVTAIDGSSVTLQLGELSEQQQPSGDASSGDAGITDSTDASTDGQTPPDKPDGESGAATSDGEIPPDKPDGESGTAPSGSEGGTAPSDGEAPPDKPDGESGDAPSNGGMSGEMPSGMGTGKTFTAGTDTATIDLDGAEITDNGEAVELSSIEVGDVLSIVFGDSNKIESVTVENVGTGFGGSGKVNQGTAVTTISEDGEFSSTSYSSTGDDENALRVDGATVTLDGISVSKSAGSSSNTEDGDFYGMNAALLATNGATVTIKNATVTSSAQNGNGVFSYGEGTTVNISDSVITTTADNSGGIQTTGGGTTNATNLTVNTSGSSAAAIRSDRGGGTVNVDSGSYTSNGYNSPAVYSTAAITVKNAELTANNSEALVIEGQNSITLSDCEVYGNMSDTKGTSSDENVHSVMIYQSMSGDADVGSSSFSMAGGSLVSNNGDVFYITNTACTVYLSGVNIVNNEADGYLMLVSGNSASHGWGTAGKNGAQVEFTADGQTLSGDIAVDSISTLNLTLSNGSVFKGTISIIENAAGGTAVDNNAVVTIDKGCTWTLTGNCTVTSLVNSGTINFNGYTITLADGTVLSE